MQKPNMISRQLVCVMFTDMVGYTTLMGEDENLALSVLNKNRNIQKPIIEGFGGTWIKELGDGVLATFPNATDSVLAAAAIQRAIQNEINLKLRIGIHLCEVVFENKDVFGDGVNIASRIQTSAETGTILISESVQKNLSNKRGIETQFIGVKEFKHVKDPVAVFQVILTEDYEDLHTSLYQNNLKQKVNLAEEKSIAILPFENLNNDPEQEYFSDGMAEEILNSLSNFKTLKVICRTSSFQFKGQNLSLFKIGEILCVSKILIGSVRRQNNQIRVTAQLINVADNSQVWSEKFDREMTDIFKLQDEIALIITQKLEIELMRSEKEELNKTPTENLEAYEFFLKGQFYWNKRGRWLLDGFKYYQKAVETDPNFALAYAGLADAYVALGLYGFIPPVEAFPKGKEAAQKAIAINPGIGQAYTSLAFLNGFYEHDHYMAHKNFLRGLEINPNLATGHYWYSFYLNIVEHDLSLAEKEGLRAVSLEPHNIVANHVSSLAFLAQRKFDQAIYYANCAIDIDASFFLPYFALGWTYIGIGDFEKAINALNISLEISGRHSWPLGFLVLAKSLLGEEAEARLLLDEIIERDRKGYFSALGSVIGAMALGESKLALGFLEKGYQNNEPLIPCLTHFQILPPRVKTDPGILAFLKKIKLLD